MYAEKGARPEEINQGAGHVLFVEGENENSTDYVFMDLFFKGKSIKTEILGPSYHHKSTAQALSKIHPSYYFIVDRDHQSSADIEESWRNFPDPNTSNILIWRKREIENYFLIPEYLASSSFLKKGCSVSYLKDAIIKAAGKRVFFDAANIAIIEIREILKQEWIKLFSNPSDFKNKDDAIRLLKEKPEFEKQKNKTYKSLSETNIEKRFFHIVDLMFGGEEKLKFGKGEWFDLVSGKETLNDVVGKCFRVRGTDGRIMQGKERLIEIVKDLARKPLEEQPDDFQQLFKLIENRINT